MKSAYDNKIFQDGNKVPKIRAILIGNSNVGKTSLITRYLNNEFREVVYPTKDVIITRNLINFNPNPEDLNDYCYVELIDTIGYDTGVRLQEYYEFFNVSLPLIKDISKIKCIADRIKYQFKTNKEVTSPGDCIMAYLFVFDYNDKKSLKDILVLAKEIKFQEKIRLGNQAQQRTGQKNRRSQSPLETIKIFIANKCPFLVEDDAPVQNSKKEIIYPIYKIDETAELHLNEILPIYDNDREEAMENLFFVNAKYNIGVNKVFGYMAKEVIQKEDLWKILKYDENKIDANKNLNLMDDVNQVSCFEMIFLCKCKKAPDESANNEKQEEASLEEENNVPAVLNESEEINEVLAPDYNTNSSSNKERKIENVNNNIEQKKEIKEKGVENTGSGCIIM